MIVWGEPSLSFKAANAPEKGGYILARIGDVCSAHGEIKKSRFGSNNHSKL